ADPVSKTTNEDTAVTVTLSASDADSGETPTDFQIDTPPAFGTLGTIQLVGCVGDAPSTCTATVDYTPDPNFNGPDGFTYTARGADLVASAPATVDITVDAVNDNPTFTVGADVTVDEDSGAYSDPAFITDGSPGPNEGTQTLTYTVVATDTDLFSALPAVSASGDLTFTPAPDAFGSTSVSVTLDDGAGGSAGPQSFGITIDNRNDPPSFIKGPDIQAALDNPGYDAAWATSISPGPGESDTVSFVLEAQDPSLFSDQPAVDSTGQLTFTPNGLTPGSTTVSVKAVDDGTPPAESAQQTFAITIFDGTSAIAQTTTVTEDSANNPITLTGFDPEADPLTYAIATQPAHGTLSGTGPDQSYTPAANFFGTDTFTFTVTDGVHISPAATVTITVANVNDPVDARSDAVTVKATTTTTLNVFQANGGSADSAGPGEPISEVTITAIPVKPTKGTVTINSGGTRLSYDPTGCNTGTDTFQYTISDGQFTDTATVVVTIARPTSSPITDTPAVGFITNSTMGSTVPMKLSWCGVTKSTTSVKSYKVLQSTNGGSTYPTTLFSATTARSSTRSLSVSRDYKWKARTVDKSGRIGSYRASPVSRITRIQNTSTRITYTGTWRTHTTSSASGGSERYTSQNGAYAEITVTNVRAFAIVGPKSATRGSFKVFVDGTLVKTVSERASSTAYRRVLYVRGVASGMSHLIRIQCTGTGRIDLDAILTLSGQ
ncbi:MAG TPA: tandem-95 repeat protein, partial [Candidatus Limnocylindrales bacterium]|nr:tandem-95 repeat protein [Candidatus Limnocylindrales bacterium]